ncbi:hypothetical protein C0J52_02849 [Blattella germanica]|nr:hypothetical protein C0J52_02849 [Blattella germanica]
MASVSFLGVLETINGTQDLSDIEHKNLIQISVDDFQKFTDNGTGSSQINWKEYFRVMFDDIDVSVLGSDKIIVLKPEYFKRLATIMSSKTRKIIDILIYWEVAALVPMHTTDSIRRSTEYFNKFYNHVEATEARSMICTRVVSHTMEMATSSYIINSEISNTNELKVRGMFDNIRKAFLGVINASTWLDTDSKDIIKSKVELSEEQFLLSAMNISKWKMEKVLSSLSTGVRFYMVCSSSRSLKMESRIIRKENVSDTWEDIFTLEELLNRRNCIIENYNSFGWGNDLKVNGANTVDENMADHGGVQVSLLAYQALKLNEPKLPGFENYTHEKLFFLSVANFFCNEMTEVAKEATLSDVHAPPAFRLLGTVTNSEEFSRIWGCPLGTKMNPRRKCKLW